MSAFNALNTNYYGSPAIEEERKAAVQHQSSLAVTGSNILFKAKFGFRFSKLTDKLLRNMEQNGQVRDKLGAILRHVGTNSDTLASMTVKLTF